MPEAKQYSSDARDLRASRAIYAGDTISLGHIISFDALYESMNKCRHGVMWKDSTASFVMNGIERTLALESELLSGAYRSRPVSRFRITSPKPREICSVSFRDRVFQRSLNDNDIYPAMSRSFIYDNFACQKGKGTDAARDRLKSFLREHHRKHGTSGYVAQFDIRGYYPNMDHEMAEDVFRRRLHPAVFAMAQSVLHAQYEGNTGYNPGSQLIQIAGISVLDGIDHFIKERLHAHLYIRYMDDFLIIHPDAAYLEHCHAAIAERLALLKFELNPKKTRIYGLEKGIEFLGFRFSITDSGKILMNIKPENVKVQRKKLFRLVKRSRRGLIPKNKVDESYRSWRNHAEKGNSFHLLQRMDAYYKNLWR